MRLQKDPIEYLFQLKSQLCPVRKESAHKKVSMNKVLEACQGQGSHSNLKRDSFQVLSTRLSINSINLRKVMKHRPNLTKLLIEMLFVEKTRV